MVNRSGGGGVEPLGVHGPHHHHEHHLRYEGSRVASSAALQRMGAAAKVGEHMLQAAAVASSSHANAPMNGSGSGSSVSAAETIATHLATALGALVQQTVLLADPRTASAHIQKQNQPLLQQQELPVPSSTTAETKNELTSRQNKDDDDDDDEGMEEVKADDDDDDDDVNVQITPSQAQSSSSSGPAPSEAVLTAVQRDVEASRRFMLSMRQFDLTSEGSLSPASSYSDSHIHNPNQSSWSHLRHLSQRRGTGTGTGTGSRTRTTEGLVRSHEWWHDDEDSSSDDSYVVDDVGVSIGKGNQPVRPSKLDQHRALDPKQSARTRHPTMLVSSVLACPSTRAVIAIGDEELLEGCLDSSLDLGMSGGGGTTLRRLHVSARPHTTTTSIPISVPTHDQDDDNEEKEGEKKSMKRPSSFTQLLDETNTTDDDLDDNDVSSEENNASRLAAPPPGIRLWTTAKKE